jgi:hypothetical protein
MSGLAPKQSYDCQRNSQPDRSPHEERYQCTASRKKRTPFEYLTVSPHEVCDGQRYRRCGKPRNKALRNQQRTAVQQCQKHQNLRPQIRYGDKVLCVIERLSPEQKTAGRGHYRNCNKREEPLGVTGTGGPTERTADQRKHRGREDEVRCRMHVANGTAGQVVADHAPRPNGEPLDGSERTLLTHRTSDYASAESTQRLTTRYVPLATLATKWAGTNRAARDASNADARFRVRMQCGVSVGSQRLTILEDA